MDDDKDQSARQILEQLGVMQGALDTIKHEFEKLLALDDSPD